MTLGYHGVLVPEALLRYRRHIESRNTLTKQQQHELKWQLRMAYPRLYWRKYLAHPFSATYWGVRYWGLWRTKQARPRDLRRREADTMFRR